jgi:hypothetical protein
MSLLKHQNVLRFLEHIFDPATHVSYVVTEFVGHVAIVLLLLLLLLLLTSSRALAGWSRAAHCYTS